MGELNGSNGAPKIDSNPPEPDEAGFLSSWWSPCQNVHPGVAIPLGADSKKMEIRLEEEANPAPGVTVQPMDDPNFSMYPVSEDQIKHARGSRIRSGDEASASAFARFREAGIGPRKREFAVEEFIANSEPEDKNSIAWMQWYVVSNVEGPQGRFFFIVLVVINGILIGVQADHGDSNEEFFEIMEYLLVTIFTVEIVSKLFGLGHFFWEDSWNVMDLIIIAASWIEIIVSAMGASQAPGLSSIRLIRVLRVIRLVGMLERLATLATAFIEAGKQVLWVAVLCLVFVYIFAVLGQGLFANSATLDANQDFNRDFFSNIPRTMLTLFQLMTMDDWANVMRPIGESLPWSWLYTMCFVCVGSLGLMNLITAVFIEELMTQTRLANKRKEEGVIRDKEAKLALCREAIKDFDNNKDGKLSPSELRQVLNELETNRLLADTFKEVGVPVSSLKAHIAIAEQHEGFIDIDTLLNMVETASVPTLRRDIFELRFRIFQHERRSLGALEKLQKTVENCVDKIMVVDNKLTQKLQK